MTPKSRCCATSWRSRRSTSSRPAARFRTVIPEIDAIAPPEEVRRVVLCSGKVYYDLLAERREQGINDVAIVRVEQLYPFPVNTLPKVLAPYRQRRGGVVPGGAGEHGRLELRRPADRDGARRARHRGEAAASMSAARRRRARRPALPRRTRPSRPRWCARRWPSTDPTARGPDDMATEIKVPTLGESVTTATVARWLKQAGRRGRGRRAAGRAGDRQGHGRGERAGRRRARRRSLAPEGAEVEVGAVLGTLDRRRRRRRARRRSRRQAEPAPAANPPAGVNPPPAADRPACRAPGHAGAAAGGGEDDRGAGRRRRAARRRQRQGRAHHQGRRAGVPRPPGAGRTPRRAGRQAAARAGGRRGAGADDAAAPHHRRAAEGGAEHRRHADHLQRGGHERGDGAAQRIPRRLREEARRAARLHVLLRARLRASR